MSFSLPSQFIFHHSSTCHSQLPVHSTCHAFSHCLFSLGCSSLLQSQNSYSSIKILFKSNLSCFSQTQSKVRFFLLYNYDIILFLLCFCISTSYARVGVPQDQFCYFFSFTFILPSTVPEEYRYLIHIYKNKWMNKWMQEF